MSAYTKDHLVEQPAIHLVEHELGWEVVNCYYEWSGGASELGRDGKREGGNIEHRTPNIEHRSEEKRKRGTKPALLRLNPDLPMEAVEGAVSEEILNDRFWILNGRGRRIMHPRRNHAKGVVLFSLMREGKCNPLRVNEFLFKWKTSL